MMIIKGIFLDDERHPNDVTWSEYGYLYDPNSIVMFDVVRSFDEFRSKVEQTPYLSSVVFSFDHDIQCYDSGGNEITGYDCLKWLVDFLIENNYRTLPTCVFHTMNPVGKINMERYYQNARMFLENL